MGSSVTLGGERLGSGKKNKVYLHGYERSTHDLGYIWRSSMASGTLVPFMNMVGLPGDSFDINLNAVIKTLPTVGPLFGSFKAQLDVFSIPMRLYNALLHNNTLGIGLNMSVVKIPQIRIESAELDWDSDIPLEFQQINQSSLLAYLGIRGVGKGNGDGVIRKFNAMPLLAYWDIYKNYYANKQEEIGAYINTTNPILNDWIKFEVYDSVTGYNGTTNDGFPVSIDVKPATTTEMRIQITEGGYGNNGENMIIETSTGAFPFLDYALRHTVIGKNKNLVIIHEISGAVGNHEFQNVEFVNKVSQDQKINVKTFDLTEIDTMRMEILGDAGGQFIIDKTSREPYAATLKINPINLWPSAQYVQQGLGLKTYQSDIFNNWLSTEWIDGEDGINKITAISTTDDYFTLDSLNLSKKVYDMLNRIAVSGGSYNDWMNAVYDEKPYDRAESPIYMGGLSKEIVFQEVVSTAAVSEDDPLGSLAGKGGMSGKHKGGKVNVKCNEPCMIIGIASITPRVDYSQGNDWSMNLRTMDDLHKPALDEIGFQDSINGERAFWSTQVDEDGEIHETSAGKVPAWLNYMTNFNKTYGNFADSRKEMYMTLNRRYEPDRMNENIKDLTTYIDPSKFNYLFAQTNLDSQNFWVQIACDVTARRKMSAKVMPNL